MSNSEEADARNDAVENVKERAESWDPGAEPETVEQHLREGFEQAGVDVPEQDVERIADEVHKEKDAQIEE